MPNNVKVVNFYAKGVNQMGQLLTSAQLRAARAMLMVSQKELVALSGVSKPTINRIENQSKKGLIGCRQQTALILQRTFENEGIVFTDVGVEFPFKKPAKEEGD